MIDLDYGPGVFALWIAVTIICPAIYGIFFVDANWEKHKDEDSSEDVFN